MVHHAIVKVTAIAAIASIQDLGRRGTMQHGLPNGGALIPEGLAVTNRIAENPVHTAGIEFIGTLSLTLTNLTAPNSTDSPSIVIVCDNKRYTLSLGQTIQLKSDPRYRVSYIAIRNGLSLPEAFGSKSTYTRALLGGITGKNLAKNDELIIPLSSTTSGPSLDLDLDLDLDIDIVFSSPKAIRVLDGPDAANFPEETLDKFTNTAWTIDHRSDRMGVRLTGPALENHQMHNEFPSAPMVVGAIEVPQNGLPIVFGPDHPTTGGYPLIAVVIHADLGRFFAKKPGETVVFQRIELSEAQHLAQQYQRRYFSDAP